MSIYKELREQSGLSVNDFAKKIGLNRASIWGYEAGKRIPSRLSAYKIIDAMAEFGIEVKIEQLMNRGESNET